MMTVTSSLTSRERVQRMFAREDHDRVPRHDTYWPETLDRWMKEGLGASDQKSAWRKALDLLESDLHLICWCWPHPFPGREDVIEEDEETRVTIGPSGTIERNWKNKSGVPEHIGWELDSRERWEQEYKPALLSQDVQLDIDEIRDLQAEGRAADRWTYLAGVESFECCRKLLGDERMLYEMLDHPEWIQDIAETVMTVSLRNFQAVIDAGIEPDGLWVYGDMAFKNMTFCSPATYRELVWPQHQRVADWAHANGMKLIYHTDGDVREIMDLFIEAGVDALQPLESKASMDVRSLAPMYGDRLAFFGNIDVMKLITNDLDVIEEDVSSKFAAGMATRGYIYHSDHSVPPGVSWETYQALVKMIDKYGAYR